MEVPAPHLKGLQTLLYFYGGAGGHRYRTSTSDDSAVSCVLSQFPDSPSSQNGPLLRPMHFSPMPTAQCSHQRAGNDAQYSNAICQNSRQPQTALMPDACAEQLPCHLNGLKRKFYFFTFYSIRLNGQSADYSSTK